MLKTNDLAIILLADDDIDDRYIFESAVKDVSDNCRVLQVEDGEKLIDFINKSSVLPDFVVLDINMPKVSGLECLRHIKNNDKYKHASVIMLSTSTNDVDVNEAFNHGASLYIRKPHSYTELKNILEYCIKHNFLADKKVCRENFVILESRQLHSGSIT